MLSEEADALSGKDIGVDSDSGALGKECICETSPDDGVLDGTVLPDGGVVFAD